MRASNPCKLVGAMSRFLHDRFYMAVPLAALLILPQLGIAADSPADRDHQQINQAELDATFVRMGYLREVVSTDALTSREAWQQVKNPQDLALVMSAWVVKGIAATCSLLPAEVRNRCDTFARKEYAFPLVFLTIVVPGFLLLWFKDELEQKPGWCWLAKTLGALLIAPFAIALIIWTVFWTIIYIYGVIYGFRLAFDGGFSTWAFLSVVCFSLVTPAAIVRVWKDHGSFTFPVLIFVAALFTFFEEHMFWVLVSVPVCVFYGPQIAAAIGFLLGWDVLNKRFKFY